MGIDVDSWGEKESREVEETISLMASSFNLDPEDVKSAIRRDTKIRKYNQSDNSSGGRPSKKEQYVDRFKKIVTNNEVDEKTKIEEISELIDEMDVDVSKGTRYNIRRGINQEFNIYIRKRFKNMVKQDYANFSKLSKSESSSKDAQ